MKKIEALACVLLLLPSVSGAQTSADATTTLTGWGIRVEPPPPWTINGYPVTINWKWCYSHQSLGSGEVTTVSTSEAKACWFNGRRYRLTHSYVPPGERMIVIMGIEDTPSLKPSSPK